ncbi:polyprenyl synthetase family protein [Algoriphagus halophytocola]|uniref:Polyprenyl synthetase family protein n=1 Tax=Algoriphagus halophytocola TaxID=2991499 RepID=A0ABY6MG98_9BACT|nr:MULTISPECIES: polyprenyl synthetase family protein [unclassified Algoriphagus]UZD22213.1 polyprenyl synthetase family protein [Algoriphagus sp. TR-M5]WBL43463.1 polyprenyl synthetase family protein [Algoriphagus sp. TR-M9]
MTKRSHAPALLGKLETFIQNLPEEIGMGNNPKELYDPITYILGLDGKRIRPLLSLLAYGIYADKPDQILSQAAAVEVFHNFTLMHDDIMDNAPLRRGRDAVHVKWNRNIAILSGDVMLVKAYDLLLATGPEHLQVILKSFNKTASEVCEGQQLDMNFESERHVNEADYLTMIRLKTAVLLGFALKLGATLAGAEEQDAQKLYDFGVNVGVGFQLKDDLLDVFADQEKFGKQVGGDIISNKKTFLLIKALELATGEEARLLNHWLDKSQFDKEEKVAAIKGIYERLGIRKLTETKMNSFFEEGFAQLDTIKYNNEDYYLELRQITEELIHREK